MPAVIIAPARLTVADSEKSGGAVEMGVSRGTGGSGAGAAAKK